MITLDEAVSSLAKFYFFAFADEELALKASQEAFNQVQKDAKQGKKGEVALTELILVGHEFYQKYLPKKDHPPRVSFHSGWEAPQQFEIAPWLEFKKRAHPDEIFVYIWQFILQASTESLASALGVSLGTILFRLAQSSKTMGQILTEEPRLG